MSCTLGPQLHRQSVLTLDNDGAGKDPMVPNVGKLPAGKDPMVPNVGKLLMGPEGGPTPKRKFDTFSDWLVCEDSTRAA